jgi:hypothetical protein
VAICKVVVNQINSSGNITSTRDEKIGSSTVTRYGTRTVDQGVFKFGMGTKIDVNDRLTYIQDIVDTEYLSAIYNFQLTVNDEGGYNMNPSSDLPASRFESPNASNNNAKFQSQYTLKFDESSTDHYDIPNNSRLDMSKQFDLYVYCDFDSSLGSYSSGDKAIIFSKYNTNGGIEVGFKSVSSVYRLFVKTKASGSNAVERVGTTQSFGNKKPRLIRIKRDENNLVSCYLDGVFEFSFTDTTDYGNGTNIRIGSNSSGSDKWGGHIMQLRFYKGSYLTDLDHDVINLSSSQPMTIKLSGTVWKINDQTSPKQVFVRGDGKILVETNINPDILTGTATSPNRTKNVYDDSQDNWSIVEDILSNVDNSFKFKEAGSNTGSSGFSGKFIATGKFIQCIDLLLLESDSLLFTNNKIVTVEKRTGVATPFKFVQGTNTNSGFKITHTGKDDALLVNELELVGRLNNIYAEQTFGSGTNSVVSLSGVPTNLRVESPNNTTITAYTVDYEAKTVTITGSHSAGTIYYWYEDVNSTQSLYWRNSASGSGTGSGDGLASANRYGKYDRRIYTPQLTTRTDLQSASTRIIADNDEVLERYEVEAPTHINCLRENHKIKIKNSIKSIDVTSTVKSITWSYPNIRTIIQVGEHKFDSFDLEKMDSQSQSQLAGNTFKTHNT